MGGGPAEKPEDKPAPVSSSSSPSESKAMTPLQLLRHYTMNGVSPRVEDGLVWFGESVAFPPDTRTNFKATPKFDSDVEYYTLQTLIYFLKVKNILVGIQNVTRGSIP